MDISETFREQFVTETAACRSAFFSGFSPLGSSRREKRPAVRLAPQFQIHWNIYDTQRNAGQGRPAQLGTDIARGEFKAMALVNSSSFTIPLKRPAWRQVKEDTVPGTREATTRCHKTTTLNTTRPVMATEIAQRLAWVRSRRFLFLTRSATAPPKKKTGPGEDPIPP